MTYSFENALDEKSESPVAAEDSLSTPVPNPPALSRSLNQLQTRIAPHPPLVDETAIRGGLVQDQARVFYTDLKTLEASLRIGKELFDTGDSDGALQHFEDVVATLRGKLGQRLMTNGFALDHVINDASVLPLAVRDRSNPDRVVEAWAHVLRDVGDHTQLVDPADRLSPVFALDIAGNLLDAAAKLYKSAAAKGEGEAMDVSAYQTARGLVWTARDLIGSQASAMAVSDPGKSASLMMELGRLQAVWARMCPNGDSPAPKQVSTQIAKVKGLLASL